MLALCEPPQCARSSAHSGGASPSGACLVLLMMLLMVHHLIFISPGGWTVVIHSFIWVEQRGYIWRADGQRHVGAQPQPARPAAAGGPARRAPVRALHRAAPARRAAHAGPLGARALPEDPAPEARPWVRIPRTPPPCQSCTLSDCLLSASVLHQILLRTLASRHMHGCPHSGLPLAKEAWLNASAV